MPPRIPTNGRYSVARAPIRFGGTTTPFLPNGISLIDRESLEQAGAAGDDCKWITLPDGRHICINPEHVNVVHTDDVQVAIKALAAGKKVVLNQKREVATLLGALADIARDAEAKGQKAPNYDLCKVSVAGTNLFCAETKGIPRIEMPQLNGKPIAGSLADKLPRDQFGNVNITEGFLDHLRAKGVTTTEGKEDAEYLRASQDELNGVKVGQLMRTMAMGTYVEPRTGMVISSDNYVVDGHHRWAATVGLQYVEGRSISMPVIRVNLPILTLLSEAKIYAHDQGLPQVGLAHGVAIKQREAIHEALAALTRAAEVLCEPG